MNAAPYTSVVHWPRHRSASVLSSPYAAAPESTSAPSPDGWDTAAAVQPRSRSTPPGWLAPTNKHPSSWRPACRTRDYRADPGDEARRRLQRIGARRTPRHGRRTALVAPAVSAVRPPPIRRGWVGDRELGSSLPLSELRHSAELGEVSKLGFEPGRCGGSRSGQIGKSASSWRANPMIVLASRRARGSRSLLRRALTRRGQADGRRASRTHDQLLRARRAALANRLGRFPASSGPRAGEPHRGARLAAWWMSPGRPSG
jgi:hypothetical protein